MYVGFFLIFLCIMFTVWFFYVVCYDALRTQEEDMKNGEKFVPPVYKVVWKYLKRSFWYHLPKL